MKYRPENIKVVDPEKHLIKCQAMYFGSRKANPENIVSGIAEGAHILGARSVLTEHKSEYWVIAADLDWLGVENAVGVNEDNAFSRLHAFPEWGVNAFRSEFLAKVFSSSTITFKEDEYIKLIYGPEPEIRLQEEIIRKYKSYKRVVCFKFCAKV